MMSLQVSLLLVLFCSEECFFLDAPGDYYRLLLDGSYAIEVKHLAYETQTQYINLQNKPLQHNAQRLDFTLRAVNSGAGHV